jgi:hypothetical protein
VPIHLGKTPLPGILPTVSYLEWPPETAETVADILAQKDLRSSGPSQNHIVPILYRPFDSRSTYYTGTSRGFQCMPRGEVMQHMLTGKNLGLISARSNKSQYPDHFLCSNVITEAKCGESTTQSCFSPLYLYSDSRKKELFDTNNLSEFPGAVNLTLHQHLL